MKILLLLPLLAMLTFPDRVVQTGTADGSQITVLSFKWSRSHQKIDTSAPEKPLPARAMTQADKNYDRNVRINDPAGVRDPNADTLDGRGAALEKSVRDAEKPEVDSFAYQATIHNASKQAVGGERLPASAGPPLGWPGNPGAGRDPGALRAGG